MSACSLRYTDGKLFSLAVRLIFLAVLVCASIFCTAPQALADFNIDQCYSALNPQTHMLGSATGCGVIITVTATGFTITVPGNGNPYDGDDDTLVGIQNNSTSSLTSITLTSSDTRFGGIFGFDNDGPCRYYSGDCYGQTGYEGPDNTFTDISEDHTTGTVTFTIPIAPGGTTWFALEGTPQSISAITQTGQPMNPNDPTNLSQQFTFNNNTGAHVESDFNYLTAFNTQNDLTVVGNTVPLLTDQGITQATYQQMVAGTALASTSCYIATGEGTDSNGNPLCALLTLECTNNNNPNPAGDNCPQSLERNLLFTHIIDTPTTIMVPAGSGPSMAEGSDNWAPSVCSFIGPETGDLCPQNFQTELFVLGSDATITGGGTGKTSNSAFILGCCEPEWNTVPTVPLYSKSTIVPVSFTTTAPQPPVPNNNNWVAAQNKSLTWGVETLGRTPDPTFPIQGDTTAGNPIPCPNTWGGPTPSFTANGNVTVGGEGAYEVHFFSTACDGQEELLYNTQTDPTKNWAAFKTAPFNVDLTNPSVTGLTLNPPPVNGTYQLNQVVTTSLTCTDPISNAVASGIAMCGPGSTNYGGLNPVLVTNAAVDTSTLGVHSFGATDVAGNAVTAQTYTVVYPNADLAVIKVGPLLIKSGTNATYGIGAWNQGPGTANNVVISDVLPAGESFVSATYALVQCTKLGCSVPPPSSTPCSFANNTVTCGPIATLAPIPNGQVLFTGVGVSLVTKVNAKAGTWITNTATVSSANPDPNTRNNSFSWLTYVSK